MKTLLLTLTTAIIAMTFSSCYSGFTRVNQPVKHYDYKGRLIEETLPGGNYNTYHYDGTDPDYGVIKAPPVQARRAYAPTRNYQPQAQAQPARPSRADYDGSWKPRIP